MRSFGIGCVSILLGMFVGAALALLAVQFTGGGSSGTVAAQQPATTDQADISVSASAAYAGTQIQAAIRQTGLAKQATISLAAPNLVKVTTPVSINLLGQQVQVNATVSMRVTVQNGRVLLKIDNVDANGLNVPSELIGSYMETFRAQGEDQLNKLIQRGLQGTGLRITNVRVAADAITVDLSSR